MDQVTPFDDLIVEYMKNYGAARIGVFGSYARGEARPDSDLDLLVWFKEQQSLLGLIRMERELTELIGIKMALQRFPWVKLSNLLYSALKGGSHERYRTVPSSPGP